MVILIKNTSIIINNVSLISKVPSGHPREPMFTMRTPIKPFINQFLFINSSFFSTIFYFFAFCYKVVFHQSSITRLTMHALNKSIRPIIFSIKSSVIFILINEHQTNSAILREFRRVSIIRNSKMQRRFFKALQNTSFFINTSRIRLISIFYTIRHCFFVFV